MVIGITGPTGAGKTSALAVLGQLGVSVIDCDAVYHRLLREDESLQAELTEAFGNVFAAPGVLDRQKLGSMVFSDPQKLARLDAITRRHMTAELIRLLALQKGPVAVDAIKLFESGLAALCGRTVAVLAPREDRIRRIMARDHISAEYARLRVEAQKDDGYYRRLCSAVLYNDFTDPEAFAAQARVFFQTLMRQMKEDRTHG